MNILKFNSYSESLEMAEIFFENLESKPNEEFSYKSVLNKIVHDLKLNSKMILKYGTCLTAMYPIVNKLIKNMSLNVDINPETTVLMSIACISIAILEESSSDDKLKMENDCKSLLEELKLRGIGNGIVKKLVSCVKSIKNIFGIIYKHKRVVFNTILDMFAYTSLFIPVMNSVLYMVNKYNLNIDTLPSNFLSLGLGVTTIVAKHGINSILDRIGGINKKQVISSINGNTKIIKPVDIESTLNGEKLISEDDN